MSLLVHLARLAREAVNLDGELSPAALDPGFRDELLQLDRPLAYALTVRKVGASILVEGSLRTEVLCECARCLKSFRRLVAVEEWSVVLPLEGEERVPLVNDAVDLTPYVREDTLLALPQHPLCEPQCGGLPSAPPHGASNPDTTDSHEGEVSRWAALDRLKL